MRNFYLRLHTCLILIIGLHTFAFAQKIEISPVTDEMIENPPAEDWLMWRRTQNTWAHSPLTQINHQNVGKLKLVWQHDLTSSLQEGTPLVHDGMMYFPSPGDVIMAFNAVTGEQIWEYQHPIPKDLGEYFPVPLINRNLAIHGKLIYHTTSDDQLIALHAETGELVWSTVILDYKTQSAQQTSGPIIAKGKIISGRGCEAGTGPDACVITAHDAKTGKEIWRTGTIAMPGESNDESWGGLDPEFRRHVGTWMVPSYDPELNMIYIGTSVTAPAPKFMLKGNEYDYLYHNSTLALNADTGEIVWYYQHLVDHWDMDHPFERLLVDTEVVPDASEVEWINPSIKEGEIRKVVTGIPGKTGIIYTLDRETGEFLWARPTIRQNVIKEIKGDSGKVITEPTSVYNKIGEVKTICPHLSGGKNWPSGSYDPNSGLMFMPVQAICMKQESMKHTLGLSGFYGLKSQIDMDNTPEEFGRIYAISARTGKTAWVHEQSGMTLSLLTTASGLLFGGDAHGYFRAIDSNTGKVLWETSIESQVTGYPATYAVNGKQYVAVSTGASLPSTAYSQLTPDVIPKFDNRLYVFSLSE